MSDGIVKVRICMDITVPDQSDRYGKDLTKWPWWVLIHNGTISVESVYQANIMTFEGGKTDA